MCKLHHSLHLCYLPKKTQTTFHYLFGISFSSVLSCFSISSSEKTKGLGLFLGNFVSIYTLLRNPCPLVCRHFSFSPVPTILHLHIPHVSGSSPPMLYLYIYPFRMSLYVVRASLIHTCRIKSTENTALSGALLKKYRNRSWFSHPIWNVPHQPTFCTVLPFSFSL